MFPLSICPIEVTVFILRALLYSVELTNLTYSASYYTFEGVGHPWSLGLWTSIGGTTTILLIFPFLVFWWLAMGMNLPSDCNWVQLKPGMSGFNWVPPTVCNCNTPPPLCVSACPGGVEAPCSNNGQCNDGLTGSGRCTCKDGFRGRACELCESGRYGPSCTGTVQQRQTHRQVWF